jgi:thymidylate synthase (FAD)
MNIIKQSATLEFVTPNALEFIERMGRVCYKSENLITPGSAKEFVKMIMNPDKKHESVIEHAYATFRFITDRGVTHEIVRHRIASYSQESTRYCNYSKNKFGNELTMILPVWFYGVEESGDMALLHRYNSWLEAMKNDEMYYFNSLSLGDVAQQARDILPNSLKTEIIMTANLREWRHFFALRCAPSAHPQMRELAIQALKQLHAEVELLFDEYYDKYCI